MAISLVSTTTATGVKASTTITTPSIAVQAGDLIYAIFCGSNSAQNPNTMTDSLGDSVIATNDETQAFGVAGFARTQVFVAGSTTSSLTVTGTCGVSGSLAMIVQVVRGANTTSATVQAGLYGLSSTTSTTAPSATTQVTLASGDMVIGAEYCAGPTGDTFTQDSDTTNGSWTSSVESGTSGGSATTNITLNSQTKIVTAAGAQTYNPTLGTARYWVAMAHVVKVSSGATTQNATATFAATSTFTATSSINRVAQATFAATSTFLAVALTNLFSRNDATQGTTKGNWAPDSGSTATARNTTLTPPSGVSACVEVTATGGVNSAARTALGMSAVACTPGVQYTFLYSLQHATAMAPAGTAALIQIAFWDSGGAGLGNLNDGYASVVGASGTWVANKFTFTAPAGATFMAPYLTHGGGASIPASGLWYIAKCGFFKGNIGATDWVAPGSPTPEMFGAVGNGTTDDQLALQAALNFTGDGDVLICSQTYAHSGVLTVSNDGARITGTGTILATAENTSEFYIAANRVTVDGSLTFQMQSTTYRGSAFENMKMRIGAVTLVTLDGITLEGASAAGLYVMGDNFLINNVTINNTRADGIHCEAGANNGVISNCHTYNTGDDGIAVVSVQASANCHDISITNNVVNTSATRGIAVVGGTNITITGSTISNCQAAGLYVASEPGYTSRAVDTVTIDGTSVANCALNTSLGHGAIMVYNGQTGVYTVSNVTFKNLAISGTNTSTPADIRIQADTTSCIVSALTFMNIAITGGPTAGFNQVNASGTYTMINVTKNGTEIGGRAAAVTMAASSTFTANGTVPGGSVAATASFAAASSMTATAIRTAQLLVTMAATATFTATAVRTAVESVTMAASSTFTANAVRTATESVTMAASSSFTATGLRTATESVTMAATSTFTATAFATSVSSVTFGAVSTFTAVGTVTTGSSTINATVSFSATSTFTATAFATSVSSVTFGAVSTFTATDFVFRPASVTFDATSAFTITGVVIKLPTVTFAAVSSFTATDFVFRPATVTFGATSVFTATDFVFRPATVAFGATSTFTATGLVTKTPVVTFDAVSTFTATDFVFRPATVTFGALSTFVATSGTTGQVAATATFDAASTFTATDFVFRPATVAFAAASTFTATQVVTAVSSVAFAASSTFTIAGVVAKNAAVTMGATSTFTIAAAVAKNASVTYGATSTFTATALRTAAETVTFGATGTFTASGVVNAKATATFPAVSTFTIQAAVGVPVSMDDVWGIAF